MQNGFTSPPPQQPQAQQGNKPKGFTFSDSNKPSAAQVPEYKPNEKPQAALPSYAKGVDPYGNPYFGDGLVGIGKKWVYNFTKDVKEVDDSEWNDLKSRWDDLLKRQNTEHGNAEEFQIAKETASLGWDYVSKLWQSGSSEGSLLSIPLKFTGSSVTAIGEIFSIPAVLLEQGIGATQGFKEAANEADSLLPRLDQNGVTKFIENLPIGLAYDFARIAFSSNDNKWSETGKKIEEGWQAGRIMYSQVFDQTLKEKFLREYRAGGDPALIAMRLQNPLAELGGQLILDPLNLVGVVLKGGKTAKQLADAKKALTSSGLLKLEKGAEALKALETAQDEVATVKAMDTLMGAQQEALAIVKGESKILKVGYGIQDLTTASRREGYVQRSKDFLGLLSNNMRAGGMNNEAIVETLYQGIRSVSKNADEMRAGLSALSHMPNANMFLSDQALETFTVMANLMGDTDGVVDGSRLLNLMKAKDPAEFAEEATKILARASHAQFPDVSELEAASKLAKQAVKEGGVVSAKTTQMAQQFADLPNHVKYMNRVNNALTKYVKNPINALLSPLYFNLQGGVAVKNIITNDELVLIDQGAKAWVKDGKYWSLGKVDEFLKDVFGELPQSAHGFESLVSATGGKSWGFGKIMEAGEAAAAKRIVGASVKDTFSKMMVRGKVLMDPAADVEKGFVTAEQAADLDRLVRQNNGNVAKAVEAFRAKWSAGFTETWRNLDFLTDVQRKALDKAGYLDEIEELARTGAASQDDVLKVINNAKKSIASRSELAVGDVIGLNQDHLGAETWGDLMKAVDDGLIDPKDEKVFTAIMESAEQARTEYSALLDDVSDKARDALSRQGRLQEANDIAKQMRDIRQKLQLAGPATAKETAALTKQAWTWTEEVRSLRGKKNNVEEYKKLWTRMGLSGQAPVDVNEQALLGELWRQTREQNSTAWGAMLDTVVGESETVIKQISKVVDGTEIQAMAARTRNITAQAQMYRKAVYDGKALRVKANKGLRELAKDYGIATATSSGAASDQQLLNIINKYSNDTGKIKDITAVSTSPVADLPPNTRTRFAEEAKRLLSELFGGEAGKRAASGSFGSTNVKWYSDLNAEKGWGKSTIENALNKIIAGEGDTGVVVERLKETIMANFTHGDALSGTPPDLNVLKELNAPRATMEQAVNAFNDITGMEMDQKQIMKAFEKGKVFQSVDEVPYDVAKAALDRQRQAAGLEPLQLVDNGVAIPPPHPDGSRPSLARAWNENSKGLNYILDTVQNEITSRWGKVTEGAKPSPQMDDFLKRYASFAEPRIAETKGVALRVADEQRKFTLLNYGERTYGDVALSYLMPYHFFYTRSYGNWVKRIATSPQLVAGYGKYKKALENINKDLPDWYKQQLDVTKLLGIETDHPLFFNLESTFNPLYGLTGTDFNDPTKRTNWVTATFDDMGKFGPTLWAPIQMAIAATLYKNGQTDAATRWGNRLIPQTAQIKAVSSFFGKPIELDPAVNFFSGGIDPYERGRMGYAAAELIQSGKYTAESVQAQFAAQKGPAWDEAYRMAVNSRAASSISSYFLGVGFKPRSTNDVMVEDMYTKLNQLYATSDMMDKDTYKAKWEELRNSYPPGLVDSVLLAKKGGDKRDAAYAYNVLGRLPPGKMSDIFKSLGITQEDVSRFYESKGFTDPKITFTATEKQRFMAAIVDLGAMLKIPDSATSGEWNDVRKGYNDILEGVKVQFGDDIWDKVSHYYDLKDDDRQAAEQFKADHPEVVQALQMKQGMIATDPLVNAYYGGLDTIEAYINGQVRQQLTEKYGKDIYDKQTEYFNIKISDPKAAKAYLNQHPELKQYWTEKAELEDAGNALYVQMGAQLPEQKGAQIQEGFTPQSGVQKGLVQQIQVPKIPSWNELVLTAGNDMSPAMQQIIQAYWTTGAPIEKAAASQLNYLASRYGAPYGVTTGDDFLRLAGLSMQQAPEQAASPEQAPQGFQFSQ